jgi:hypothetical protein
MSIEFAKKESENAENSANGRSNRLLKKDSRGGFESNGGYQKDKSMEPSKIASKDDFRSTYFTLTSLVE